jgi:uncharacterized membrane protein YhhN
MALLAPRRQGTVHDPARSSFSGRWNVRIPAGSTGVYAVLAATDAALAAANSRGPRRVTKPLLMPTLMVGRDRPTQRALALGGVGDACLLSNSSAAFTAGLASFLAGHLAWVAALRKRYLGGLLMKRPPLAAPYLVVFVGLNAHLWKRTGKDRVPIVLYSSALLTTALVGLDSGSPKAAAGGALFMVSDALLALDKFGDVHLPAHQGLVMASYSAAQALLAAEGRFRPGQLLTSP